MSVDSEVQTTAAADEQLLVTVPGAELYTELVGHNDAAVVYYLHGGPGYSSYSFRELMGDDLADWRVLYADMRGGGRSFSQDGRGSQPEVLADDVAAVVAAHGLASVVLLAHGFGAIVAIEAALRHPDKVVGVVLVNPWVSLPVLATRLLSAATALAAGQDPHSSFLGDEAGEADYAGGAATADAAFSTYNPKALFDALQFPQASSRLYLEHVDSQALPGPQEEDSSDAVWELDSSGRLSELAASGTRLVVLAGDQDGTSFPEQVERVLELVPTAMFSSLPGGHYLWLDTPEEFVATLSAALAFAAGTQE